MNYYEYRIDWLNSGSFLQNEPRYFSSETEARTWCREQGLQRVTEHLRLGTFKLTKIFVCPMPNK